jgi:hypothetical protein
MQRISVNEETGGSKRINKGLEEKRRYIKAIQGGQPGVVDEASPPR